MLKNARSRLKRRWFPEIELLEDRCVPAGFGTIQGVAFVDSNANGIFDASDARLPGVTVQLSGTTAGVNGNTSINASADTGADGVYSFTSVPTGDYSLNAQTIAAMAGGGVQPDASVTVSSNGQVVVRDFAYVGLAPTIFSLRFFLTNTSPTALPYDPAGAGADVADIAPTVAVPFSAVTTTTAAANTVLDLAGHFRDADFTNSLVRFNITDGTTPRTIALELFDGGAPQTVTNFFDYITAGSYNNSVFHRLTTLVPDGLGVLQGGALAYANALGTNLIDVPVGNQVPNEFSNTRLNTVGTIAMAQSGGNINSATNQFFFNTTANPSLDTRQFAVFGRVADDASQSALAALATTSTIDLTGGAFAASHPTALINDFPLHNYGGNSATFAGDAVAANYITINSISIERRDEFLTYSLVDGDGGANPAIVGVTLTNEFLTIDPIAAGTTTISVQATDRFGASQTATITVTIS